MGITPLTTEFISLRTAAAMTGYHQDYLAFLCRTGQLAGAKVARNWMTTRAAVAEFQKARREIQRARAGFPPAETGVAGAGAAVAPEAAAGPDAGIARQRADGTDPQAPSGDKGPKAPALTLAG